MSTPNPDEVQAPEEELVDEFGYSQQLRRSLSWFSLFSVSFSIMSITTGVFLNFTFGITQLGPLSIWIWPAVGVGQLLVALVLAELGARMPLAGAGYQWGSRLIGAGYGWLIGALGILYAAVGVPGIVYLAVAPLTEYVVGVNNPTPRLTLFIALLVLTVAYLVNVISVQIAARINNAAVFAEVLGTVVLAVVLFFCWVAGTKPTGHGISYLFAHHHLPGQSYWYAIALASLVGVYTLAGFEAAADVAEEARDARRAVPRAIIGSVVVSVVLGMVVLVGFTIAIPSENVLETGGGLPAVFQYWLGAGLARTFVGVVVFAMFALMVVSAAVIARLLFAMARDNMLPGSSLLRRVNPTTKTPIPALAVGYVLNFGVIIFGYSSANSFGTLVGATAVVPYLVYLLTVSAYGVKRRTLAKTEGFHLGRFAGFVFVAALVYIIAVTLTLTLPAEFRQSDYYVLGGLGLAALWWLTGLRRRISRGRAGAPVLGDAVAPFGDLHPEGAQG